MMGFLLVRTKYMEPNYGRKNQQQSITEEIRTGFNNKKTQRKKKRK